MGARVTSGLVWLLLLAAGCAADEPEPIDPCSSGAGPGRFSDQVLFSGGEERRYFIYVPTSYDCRERAPLLLHFHGTVAVPPGEEQATRPEERWTLEPSIEVAEREGVILVRPRARPREFAGLVVWQWRPEDEAPINVAFTEDLVEDLSRRYNVDPSRLYASGFSNGTNMAIRFLEGHEVEFAGFGLVGGGIWGGLFVPNLKEVAPRIYATTGYRDYQYDTLAELSVTLQRAHFPPAQIFRRATDAGHEIYGWHFAEMLDWLDKGKRATGGTLRGEWTRDASFTGDEDLLSIAAADDGSLLIGASDGAIYRQPTGQGEWILAARIETPQGYRPAITDLCLLASGTGRGIAVGDEGLIAETDDSGASWALRPRLPDHFGDEGTGFGHAYLVGVACGSGETVTGAGYWSGAASTDGGRTWQAQAFRDASGTALVAAVGLSPSGTLIAAGYPGFLGRGTVGATVQHRPLPLTVGWLDDIANPASGSWWVVGEAGTVLHSADDGKTWIAQKVPTGEDLYAVHFWDATIGMAVGAHGAAVLTIDGGSSWTEVATGLDGYLGDVRWTSASTALAVGEGGSVLTFQR